MHAFVFDYIVSFNILQDACKPRAYMCDGKSDSTNLFQEPPVKPPNPLDTDCSDFDIVKATQVYFSTRHMSFIPNISHVYDS